MAGWEGAANVRVRMKTAGEAWAAFYDINFCQSLIDTKKQPIRGTKSLCVE